MAETALERCLLLTREARVLQGDAQARKLAQLEAALEDASSAHSGDSSAEPVIVLDTAGYLTGWSEGAQAMFGYTRDEAIGQHVLFLYGDDSAEHVAELFLEGGAGLIEAPRRRKNGELIWVRLALSVVVDDALQMAGILVHLSPALEQLSDAEKTVLHARIIEDSDQGVLITDATEHIVSINSAFTRITGYAPHEAIGQTPDLLRSGVHDAEFRAKVRAAMAGEGPWRGEIVGRRKNGQLFPQSVTISVVRNAQGAITHTFSLFSDISVHKDAEARMQRMANYDSATGLPNRALLATLLCQVLVEARRSGDGGALMVIEISRIGSIGDTLGDDVASELMGEISRRFRQLIRPDDILARIGGDRFAAAMPLIEKREHAAIVAEKLLGALANPILVAGHSLQVGATIGIATYPDDAMDSTILVRYADVAVTKCAAMQGCGYLFYHREMDQRAKEHMRLETELRAALAAGELALHYQPKVSLRSGRIVGAEALLRWHHPQRGMIAPGVFIALAEETGLILDIGSWVLEEACRQVRAWRDEGLDMPPVAVNLSARQFDAHLPARVQAVLDRHGVEARQLKLEITESLLVKGADAVVSIMNELVAMGVELALDDFGTGYSSLAYLKRFPISTLKIDRTFVVGLPHEENDCAIARAIVTMAQQLRQEIVAEGVETAEQMAFLRELGCDQLQGYLFSPAVTADVFAAMQRAGKSLLLPR
ncbi:MAG: EAL domain-containing protein [Telluria sp.]